MTGEADEHMIAVLLQVMWIPMAILILSVTHDGLVHVGVAGAVIFLPMWIYMIGGVLFYVGRRAST